MNIVDEAKEICKNGDLTYEYVFNLAERVHKTETSARQQVRWFAEQMENKLKENDHKGGWDSCGIFWLRDRLVEEVEELSSAIEAGHNSESGLDLENIIREAADVGNFAMMIADKARKRLA